MKLKNIVVTVISAICIISSSLNAYAKEKVILSSDMVNLFDDGIAMMMLAKNPDAELLGVATEIGNTWVETGTASAIRQLELIGRTDIPVYNGVNTLTRKGRLEGLELENKLFGRGKDVFNGAGDYPRHTSWKAAYRDEYRTEPTIEVQEKYAVDFIVDTVKANPGEVTVVAIGTYNNLAAAVRKAPEIVPMIKRVVYMGGAFYCSGNVTPRAEFNIWLDPEAARYVWRQPFKEQIIFPLDCCEKIWFTKKRYDRLAGTVKDKSFQDMLANHWITDEFKRNPNYHAFLWDVLCAAYINDSSIVLEEETLPVDVNDVFGPTYGETLVYRDIAPIGSQKARIVFKVDEKKVWRQVQKLFKEL